MDANDKRTAEEIAPELTKNKTDSKRKTADFLKNVFFGAMYALWGYFLGGAVLPYGATPLGVSLLAASDRRVFYIYAGLVVSALRSERRLLLIGVYTALLFVRLLIRLILDPPWKKDEASGERTVAEIYPHLFSEHVSLRAASAAVGAFAIGVHRLIEGGMLYYDLYGTIISTVSAPVCVLLVSGFFSENAKKYRRIIGLLALAFGVIYSVGDTRLYGVSLAVFGCMLVTLYLSRTEGTVTGVLSGALLGLAISVKYVPLFAFAGLVSGMLYPISAVFALCSSLSVAVAWGIYTDGLSVLNGPLAALVSATLIFGVWDKLFLSSKTKKTDTVSEEKDERDIRKEYVRSELLRVAERQRLADTEQRLKGIEEGLSSISELLYGISEKLQAPCYADLRQICDSAFDSSCAGCENRSVCWGEKYRETSEALGQLCSALHRNGSLAGDEAGKELSDRCVRLPDIISQINQNSYLHARQLFEGDRTELFAADFEALSKLISSSLSRGEGEYTPDDALWQRIATELSKKGISAEGGCVLGERQKKITLISSDSLALGKRAEEIGNILSDLLDSPVSAPEIDEESGAISFSVGESISVSFAKRSLLADGENEYCGDTSGVFGGACGRTYAFISDGMGSGREAAMTSGLCGLFLRRLLTSDSDPEGALRLLNGFLRNRGAGSLHECSATVDLMELDLYLGRACLYKSGAAPTYVYRDGSLFKLRSHTVPVGIIKELDFRKIDLELRSSDVVVMVSDGVTDGREECPWLFDLLRSQSDAEPERIAELVVKYAKSEGATDDISVIVAKVK
ncbi:MAG: SpoIIE family protein phosphatase [Clostridia bacterium]|nr:SpoIIE family protein phosphatase [Clostridia bacterium]MBQ8850764.1 SpoIIE family protein phosphatase [Clostridia bacterium]